MDSPGGRAAGEAVPINIASRETRSFFALKWCRFTAICRMYRHGRVWRGGSASGGEIGLIYMPFQGLSLVFDTGVCVADLVEVYVDLWCGEVAAM